MKLTRREALIGGAVVGAGAAIAGPRLLAASGATVGQLNPNTSQFVTELFILPAMPAAAVTKGYDRYSLAARRSNSRSCRRGSPRPRSSGSVPPPTPRAFRAGVHDRGDSRPGDPADLGEPARELLRRLPAALPAGRPDDPLGQPAGRDERPGQGTEVHLDPGPYTGPVPLVVHLHGAHAYEDSDGYPEAWYLPLAKNIPKGYATVGSKYYQFKEEARARKACTGPPGWPSSRSTTTSAPRRCGTTTTPSGWPGSTSGPGCSACTTCAAARGDLPAGHLPGPAPRRGDRSGHQVLRDPADHRRPELQHQRQPVPAGGQPVLARALHPDHRHPADLERAVLRLDDHGQRQHLAEPERRAAAVPVPDPERQRGAAADPQGGLQSARGRPGVGGGAAVGDRSPTAASCPTRSNCRARPGCRCCRPSATTSSSTSPGTSRAPTCTSPTRARPPPRAPPASVMRFTVVPLKGKDTSTPPSTSPCPPPRP